MNLSASDLAQIRSYAGHVSLRFGITRDSCPISREDLEQASALAALRGRKSYAGPMQDLIRHERGRDYQRRRFLALAEVYVRPVASRRPARAIPAIPSLDILNMQERLVLERYYWGEMKYLEIGRLLGVNESRICQIHRAALEKLRAALA